MEFFRIRKTIPFMRHALVFNVISLVVFVLAVVFLATKGLHWSIEFTGGAVMEVGYAHPAEPERIRVALQKVGLTDISVQNFGTSRDVLIRLPAQKGVSSAQQSDRTIAALKAETPAVTLKWVEFVGP
ncbi:MAG: protein translocase subunit SecF, partial [Usitatibacter sp.]